MARAQRVWSAADAALHAVRRAPSVQSAQLSVATAEASRVFASVPRVGNPTLGLRLMVGVPDLPAATIGLVTGVPIDLTDRPGAFSREARWAVREAQHGLDAAASSARYDALDAWASLSFAQERLAVASALAANARALHDRVQARAREQASTALDVALAARSPTRLAAFETRSASRPRAPCKPRPPTPRRCPR